MEDAETRSKQRGIHFRLGMAHTPRKITQSLFSLILLRVSAPLR
jgi:hypothetical protein